MLIFKMDTASIIILFVVFCGLIDDVIILKNFNRPFTAGLLCGGRTACCKAGYTLG